MRSNWSCCSVICTLRSSQPQQASCPRNLTWWLPTNGADAIAEGVAGGGATVDAAAAVCVAGEETRAGMHGRLRCKNAKCAVNARIGREPAVTTRAAPTHFRGGLQPGEDRPPVCLSGLYALSIMRGLAAAIAGGFHGFGRIATAAPRRPSIRDGMGRCHAWIDSRVSTCLLSESPHAIASWYPCEWTARCEPASDCSPWPCCAPVRPARRRLSMPRRMNRRRQQTCRRVSAPSSAGGRTRSTRASASTNSAMALRVSGSGQGVRRSASCCSSTAI